MEPEIHTPPADGDYNRGPTIMAIAVVSMALAFICVCIRLFVRIRLTKNLWWDDGLIVGGLLLSITGVVFNILMVANGGGRHQYYLTKMQGQKVLQYNTLFAICNVPCVCLVKVAILLFIYRLQNSKRIAYFIHVLLFLTITVGLGTFLLMVFQCVPLNALWDHTVEGSCISREDYGDVSVAQGVIYSVLDLFITSLPVIILWKVQIDKRTKIGICVLLGLGLLATAFMIMRVVYYEQLAAADFTFDCWGVDIAAQLEQNICIIAASIPTFPYLFKTWKRTIKERSYGQSSSKKPSLLGGHSFSSKGNKSAASKKHPYNDITLLSNITVKHDIEQQSSHGGKSLDESW